MSLATARADIAASLVAAGYIVVDDPRNVTPPCVLVGIPSTITGVGACLYEADLPVTIIGTSPGNADAALWLLDTAEEILSLLGAIRAHAGTTAVQGSNQRLPSYTVEVTIP
jgi:hypothetical protein